MNRQRRSWQPACGGQTVQPASERLAVCLVCHRHIPEGRGLGFPFLRASVCQGACAETVGTLGRTDGRVSRPRWQSPGVVRSLVDGAGCEVCRVEVR
jgi:hypothetical protein